MEGNLGAGCSSAAVAGIVAVEQRLLGLVMAVHS